MKASSYLNKGKIGKGFVFIILFSCLKSDVNLIVLSTLGIIKVGAANWEQLIFLNTPI